MNGQHKRFTVSGTAYMSNLGRGELNEKWTAIHYQDPPIKTERGTSFGMRWPFLILADYIDDAQGVGEKIAGILNAHWDGDAGLALAQAILADCTDTTPQAWIEMATDIVRRVG